MCTRPAEDAASMVLENPTVGEGAVGSTAVTVRSLPHEAEDTSWVTAPVASVSTVGVHTWSACGTCSTAPVPASTVAHAGEPAAPQVKDAVSVPSSTTATGMGSGLFGSQVSAVLEAPSSTLARVPSPS